MKTSSLPMPAAQPPATMRSLELKLPPVVVVLGMGALMWAAARFTPFAAFSLPAGRVIAATFAGAGACVALLGVASFRRARTTVNPLHPEAASALVVAGIYRVTRNAMYLGMLLVLLGWGLFLGNVLAVVLGAAFVPLMNRFQVIPEERALAARFGSDFENYRASVHRWL